MSQVSVRIASPMFTKRGPWPRTSIKEYTAAPGDINTLKTNLGLAENSISVSALISVDRDGEICGSSYNLSGQGLSSWHVGYRADRIFQDASDAVNVELNIPAEAWRFEKGGRDQERERVAGRLPLLEDFVRSVTHVPARQPLPRQAAA